MSTLGLSIGALQIGVLFSTMLYGVASVQAFLYTEKNFKDAFWIKAMVFTVWFIETVHTGLAWSFLYSLTVTFYGHPEAIALPFWTTATSIPLTCFVGFCVQFFFAYRIRVLSQSYIIPAITCTGALACIVLGIILAVGDMRSPNIPVFFEHFHTLTNALFGLETAVDITNTTALCFYLIRRRTNFKTTRRVIDKLILYAIETGLVTSLCALLILICSLLMPDNMIYLGLFFIYPKLFSNSLFAMLNARHSLRYLPSSTDGGSDIRWAGSSSSGDTRQPSQIITPHAHHIDIVKMTTIPKYAEPSIESQ